MSKRSFQQYLREMEDEVVNQEQEEMNAKIVAFFTQDEEPLTDDAVHAFAEELGIEHSELEQKIYKMLKDLLMAKEAGEEDGEVTDLVPVEEGKEKSEYVVNVGNIGNIPEGTYSEALKTFNEYVKQSKAKYGRASGEDVILMKDGEPVKEYFGTNHEEDID
jgi:hypothetical protein